MDGAVFPPEASQHWNLQTIESGQVSVSKWQPLGELMPVSVPWGFCHQCSPQPWAKANPCLSRRHSNLPTVRFGPGFYGVTALPWVPGKLKTCVHPPSAHKESLFPLVLWGSCTQTFLAFKAKCCGGLLLPVLDLQAGEPNMELRTLTPVGETLQYSYFPICG